MRVLGKVSRTFRVVPLGLDPWIHNAGEHEVATGDFRHHNFPCAPRASSVNMRSSSIRIPKTGLFRV